MSFLMMVFLAFVCLFTAYPPPLWGGPVWLAGLLTLASVGVVALSAASISRRVRAPLDSDPTLLESLLVRYDSWRYWHGVLQVGLYIISLAVLGWGWFVASLYGGAQFGHGAEFALLLPFFLGQFLSWYFFYDADRAAHIASHRLLDLACFAPHPDAAPPRPVPPFGGRWSYIAFQMRQKLALALVPILLIVVRQEIFRFLPEPFRKGPYELLLLVAFGLFGIFFALPWLVRLLLGLRPLPEGPLRRRLLATAQRLHIGLCDILVWDTRGGVANALIIGLVPWARYVVFTDRFLDEFSPEETQAVFGHELGHVKHGHMLYYMIFLSSSLLVLGLAAEHYLLPLLQTFANWLSAHWPQVFPAQFGLWFDGQDDLAVIPLVLLLLAYVLLVFGYLSRHCERQADLFGCRAVSCGTPHCQGHHDDTPFIAQHGLCEGGVLTFIHALEKVALVNGIDRERPGFFQSWQHGTIAQRVAFLRAVLTGEQNEPAFQWRFSAFKWGIAASLCVALVFLIAAHGTP